MNVECAFCGKIINSGDVVTLEPPSVFDAPVHHHLKCVIDAAAKEERETCVKIVQKFANGKFIYQEAADLIIRDIQRGQS